MKKGDPDTRNRPRCKEVISRQEQSCRQEKIWIHGRDPNARDLVQIFEQKNIHHFTVDEMMKKAFQPVWFDKATRTVY